MHDARMLICIMILFVPSSGDVFKGGTGLCSPPRNPENVPLT